MTTKEQGDRLGDLDDLVMTAQASLLPKRLEDLVVEGNLSTMTREKVEQYFEKGHPDIYMEAAASEGYSGDMALIYVISYMKTDLSLWGGETIPIV